MPREDAARWNERYRAGFFGKGSKPRAIIERALPYLRPGGLILDLAMGLGTNACWLIQRGYRVIGVDISSVAVMQAKAGCPQLMAVIADLAELYLPEQAFDAVMNFYFLDRNLLHDLARIMRPGGIAIIETLMADMRQIRPDLPKENLLQKGELRSLFSSWDIHYEREEWQESDHGGQKSVAGMIAQLRGNYPGEVLQ